jgi:hypothetical protein
MKASPVLGRGPLSCRSSRYNFAPAPKADDPMMRRKFEQWFKYRDESNVNARAAPMVETRMLWA